MKNQYSGYGPESEWFYRLYADENQIDYLQLCILDLLRSGCGRMTLKLLCAQIPASNVSIRATLGELAAQDLITITVDQVILSETAAYAVDDVLDDLHDQLEKMIECDLIEEPTAHLMA